VLYPLPTGPPGPYPDTGQREGRQAFSLLTTILFKKQARTVRGIASFPCRGARQASPMCPTTSFRWEEYPFPESRFSRDCKSSESSTRRVGSLTPLPATGLAAILLSFRTAHSVRERRVTVADAPSGPPFFKIYGSFRPLSQTLRPARFPPLFCFFHAIVGLRLENDLSRTPSNLIACPEPLFVSFPSSL